MADDVEVQQHFDYVGGPFKADSYRGGLGYEVTTTNPATQAMHLLRPYVHPGRLIGYVPW